MKTSIQLILAIAFLALAAAGGYKYANYAREQGYEAIRKDDLHKHRLHGIQTLAYQAIKELSQATTLFEDTTGFPARQIEVFDNVTPSAELLMDQYSHASNWEKNYVEIYSSAEASLIRLKFFSLALEGFRAKSADEARTFVHSMTSSQQMVTVSAAKAEIDRERSSFRKLAQKFETAQYEDIPEQHRHAPLPATPTQTNQSY